VRDLWKRADLGETAGTVRREVLPHGAALLELEKPD